MTSRIKQVHIDVNNIAKSILDVTKPKVRGLYPKLFKYVNIWDMQVDEMIQTNQNKGYSFATPSFFLQLILGESVQLTQGYSSYPNAILRYYLINQVLNSGDDMEKNLSIFDSVRDPVVTAFKNSSISYCSSPILFEDEMDYKHGSIYKYKLAFKTCFIDSKGSALDPDSGFPIGNISSVTVNPIIQNNNSTN